MTEEEAKNRWCPMFQVSGINERGGSNNNRGGNFWGNSECIASECACWVWDYELWADGQEKTGHCGLTK